MTGIWMGGSGGGGVEGAEKGLILSLIDGESWWWPLIDGTCPTVRVDIAREMSIVNFSVCKLGRNGVSRKRIPDRKNIAPIAQ